MAYDLRAGTLAAAFLLVTTGCFQDFEQFRPGDGGAGGAGGEGGADPCAGVDCNDDNPCTDDICDPEGECLHPVATVFTLPDVEGDCKEPMCDGDELVFVADTADVPLEDDNPCTDQVCDGDTPDFPPLEDGITCNGDGVCSGGLCTSCIDETMCGTDTECADFSCPAGRCEADFNTGLVLSGQTDGDCNAIQCVGRNPRPQNAPFDDPQVDANECTTDTCDNGTPVHDPMPSGTACDDDVFCNGIDECGNGTGACDVHAGDPCGAGTECADTCDEAAEDCFDPVGTPCGSASNTDCTNPDTCNGSGTCLANHAAAMAACNDGLFCNGADTCNASGSCANHAGDPCAGGAECADNCNEAADNCFEAAGTGCNDGMFCNGADTCNATGVCANHAGDPCTAGTECANACNETADDCFDLVNTPCGSSTNDTCTDPDTCSGTGTCNPNHAPNATPCTPPGGGTCTDGVCGT